ncbi:MAG: DUF721 domain-containing protein [Muribaculaceae bacterium]|nr:DUF721 domain-containing protein [Muribaculaceae bacterium]
MQRYTPQSVGDVLRDLLEETSLQDRMDELKAADLWPKIAGRGIADLTSRPNVKNGVMSIGVPNASLRNELHMNRSRLMKVINDTLGKNIITEIRFTS